MNPRIPPTLVSFVLLVFVVGLLTHYFSHQKVGMNAESLNSLSQFKSPRHIIPLGPLHWYHTTHRINPIFALEGSNPKNILKASQKLEEGVLWATRHFPPEEQKLIERGLLPTSFLKTISKAESSRINFIEHPTRTRAGLYHAHLVKAIEMYIRTIDRIKETLETIPETDVTFIGGTTDLAFMQQQLTVAQNDATEMLGEEHRRFLCLSQKESDCPLKTKSLLPFIGETPPRIKEIPTRVRDVNYLFDESFSHLHKGEVRFSRLEKDLADLPLVKLDSPLCTPFEEPPAFFKAWWRESRVGSTTALWVHQVNNKYFFDLSNTKGPYYDKLHEAGLPYKIQLLHPYLCTDFMQDRGYVMSALYIKNELEKRPMFSELEDEDLFKEISRIETEIKEAEDFIEISVVRNYIIELQQVLKDEKRLGTYFSDEDIFYLWKIFRAWNTRSMWTEDTIGALDDLSLSAERVGALQAFPIHVFFASRSYYSGLLFLHNLSFVTNPVYLSKTPDYVRLEEISLIGFEEILERESIDLEQLIDYVFQSSATIESITPN